VNGGDPHISHACLTTPTFKVTRTHTFAEAHRWKGDEFAVGAAWLVASRHCERNLDELRISRWSLNWVQDGAHEVEERLWKPVTKKIMRTQKCSLKFWYKNNMNAKTCFPSGYVPAVENVLNGVFLQERDWCLRMVRLHECGVPTGFIARRYKTVTIQISQVRFLWEDNQHINWKPTMWGCEVSCSLYIVSPDHPHKHVDFVFDGGVSL